MKYYVVFMVQWRETGKEHDTVAFSKVIRADSADKAFEEWCNLHEFNSSEFRKSDNDIWRNYWPVYVREV